MMDPHDESLWPLPILPDVHGVWRRSKSMNYYVDVYDAIDGALLGVCGLQYGACNGARFGMARWPEDYEMVIRRRNAAAAFAVRPMP